MFTRFFASARPVSPSALSGSGSGSETARLNFFAMVSASSVRLIRLASAGSDLDIFFVPSFRLITRVAVPSISGSGLGKNSVP